MTDFHSYLAAHNDRITETVGQQPGFFIRTYGCQMNERDSEKLAALLIQLGYRQAESQEAADLAVYNTCCVRESAENKIFGHLSRLKRLKQTEKPHLLIAVGGCMSQQPEIAEKMKAKHPYINIVFGTANRHRLPEFIWRVVETGKQVVDITEDDDLPELDSVPVTTREYSHKAGVNIMYGCDNFCSFCIVPYVRGREKSRPVGDILREVEALAADGVKEIILLGQNVNSYGKGLTGPTSESAGNATARVANATTRVANATTEVTDTTVGATAPVTRETISTIPAHSSDITDFPTILRQINQIPGLQRIRFMTSHPKDFSDELIAAVRDLDKVCKSVHLPLQSGSTKVLEDMNRRYTQDEYLDLASRLKNAGIALSTDIIVGYPGETEEDFEATLDVARQVRFSGAFTFIYSKRSGTPAAQRTDTVPRKVASQRFERLTAALYPIMLEINQAKIGQTLPVMIEEISGAAIKGRTDDNTLVHFEAEEGAYQPGNIVPVRVDAAKTFYVTGKLT